MSETWQRTAAVFYCMLKSVEDLVHFQLQVSGATSSAAGEEAARSSGACCATDELR